MKFSIRDLLLVTVIVALVLGWAVDRWRLAAKAESEAAEAVRWRRIAGAFEEAFDAAGWEVTWTENREEIQLNQQLGNGQGRHIGVKTDFFEPGNKPAKTFVPDSPAPATFLPNP